MGESQLSLRSLSPKLYQYITDKLQDNYHIHSYDIQLDAVKKAKGIHIVIKYGEHFNHQADKFFTYDSLKEVDGELNEFVQNTGKACKQVLIDDYFRMMTP